MADDNKTAADEILGDLRKMLREAGSKPSELNEKAIHDAVKARARARAAESELAEVRKKIPAEGSVVLTADEAKELEEYRKLGKPADLTKAVTDGKAASEKLSAREREDGIRAAGKATEYNSGVLVKMPGVDQLKFEVRTEKVDGEEIEIAYVTELKDGAAPVKLKDYAEKNWKEFLPSLETDEEGERRREDTSGTRFPAQPIGEKPRRGGIDPKAIRTAKEQSGDYSL